MLIILINNNVTNSLFLTNNNHVNSCGKKNYDTHARN